MLALRKLAAVPGVALCDVATPVAARPREVLIAVAATGLCGTDLHIADWSGGYDSMTGSMPVTLGHEFAGVVASTSASACLQPGTRVVVRPSVTCGSCVACQRGDRDDCTGRRGIGIHRDGGFAAFVVAPADNCIVLPAHLDLEIAALAEPFTVCAQAIARSGLKPGARVLILGPGPIGQGIAMLASAANAGRIVAIGRHDAPRLTVLEQLTDATCIDCADGSLADALRESGEAAPFDVVFEATGKPSLVAEALAYLKRQGTLVVCGIHASPATLDLTGIVRREQTITGTYRATPAMWTDVITYLAANADKVRPMITHRLALSDVMMGLDLARRRVASKVMIVAPPYA